MGSTGHGEFSESSTKIRAGVNGSTLSCPEGPSGSNGPGSIPGFGIYFASVDNTIAPPYSFSQLSRRLTFRTQLVAPGYVLANVTIVPRDGFDQKWEHTKTRVDQQH